MSLVFLHLTSSISHSFDLSHYYACQLIQLVAIIYSHHGTARWYHPHSADLWFLWPWIFNSLKLTVLPSSPTCSHDVVCVNIEQIRWQDTSLSDASFNFEPYCDSAIGAYRCLLALVEFLNQAYLSLRKFTMGVCRWVFEVLNQLQILKEMSLRLCCGQ